MDHSSAILAFAALAQPTRLETFRLLMAHEPGGIAAGELARRLAVPQNTLSAHLAVLARAGLVRGERQSRTILYRASLPRFQELVLFLMQDCCGGRADLCLPVMARLSVGDAAPCCPSPSLLSSLAKEAAHD